ncbi:MAG: M2 family metallopeptidase [Gammaproteobacteria bacterium]|nr:M2 family metallopeptidase [Gammaproteobacteria bacterium]
MNRFVYLIFLFPLVMGCSNNGQEQPTAEQAKEFLEEYETTATTEGPVISSAYWIASNFITHDSQVIAADYGKRYTLKGLEEARKAASFDDIDVDSLDRRALKLIKNGFTMPPPLDDELAGELSLIMTELEAMYGTGKHCFTDDDCYDLEGFENIIDNSKDPDELLKAWSGWREIGKPMKSKYLRMVDIGNQGSKDLGFSGLSELWFSKYDMPSKDFAVMVDKVYEDLKPLYEALQCHVRAELNGIYGDEIVALDEPIPAHLLGNMWGQSWSNIYDLVYQEEQQSNSIDLTKIIADRNLSEIEMVEIAEDFFLSLGFKPLPDSFWQRSLFVKPQDRNVVCHASAWDIDSQNKDLRIKMCIQKNEEDFITIHHELGHIFYYQAYAALPEVFQSGANDGFHEAVGDLLSLSITPNYLEQINFITAEESDEAKSNATALLMKQALDGVVAVPWTLMLDKWRMAVFNGDLTDDELNDYWWELREKYQGIGSPMDRPVDAFDPGAKYHIPGNTPYTRYYLARILQYQFHESLCASIGFDGALHECTIYGNELAGEKLRSMLSLGQSKPWQDALETIIDERELSGRSMLNYYSPLKDWLDDQNEGRVCGW